MPVLSPRDLASRLAYDHQVMRGLGRDGLGSIRAYASHQALRAGRQCLPDEAAAGAASLYTVELRFRHLSGPGETAERSVAAFDLLAGGNYPYTKPLVTFITRPLPWSPHVHPASGIVCLGDAWLHARGKMLLAQLVVHVMRLVNFDEPDLGGEHFNPPAAGYWRTVLDCRPYVVGLPYPRLPSELTHGVESERDDGFRVASESGFRVLPQEDRVLRLADLAVMPRRARVRL